MRPKIGLKFHPLMRAVTVALSLVFVPAQAWSGDVSEMISAQEIRQKTSSEDAFILIDTRPSSLFDAYHIPGAINMRPFAIKTKVFLKRKKLVLVDDAFSICRLLELGKELRHHGFGKVRILSGGISAWNPDLDRWTLVSASKYQLQGALACNRLAPKVVDIRKKESFQYRSIPESISLPHDRMAPEGPSHFIDETNRLLNDSAGRDPLQPIILVDYAGKASSSLISTLKENGRPFSFFLEGGAMEWFIGQDFPPGRDTVGESAASSGNCKSCP